MNTRFNDDHIASEAQGCALDPVLTLESIGRVYGTGETATRALRDVSLQIGTGEMVSLVGRSGSGKSTLLNLCGLVDTATEGRLTFLDKVVSDAEAPEMARLRREYIGFVFQGFNLVPVMTVAENVAYPLWLLNRDRGFANATVKRTLGDLGIAHLASRKPDELSGGQRQRVAIARAMVKCPELIIADEPTANLDSETSQQVIGLLREVQQVLGTTVLVATHDRRVADACDRVLKVSDGIVTAEQPA